MIDGKQLNYFSIDGQVGGNQDWFRNIVMRMGGCAAATACDSCIYFAMYRGIEAVYPFQIEELNKEDYIQFAMKMKPYLSPRIQGVNRLWMYTEGMGKYLKDCGMSEIQMKEFSGEHTVDEAQAFVRSQIDDGYPVPYLLLKHTDQKYKDFMWHWFLVIGYEEDEEGFWLIAATYGEATRLLLSRVWDTGYEEKGGLIGYRFAGL